MKNAYSVKGITFQKTVTPFCELGQDYYIGRITVDFKPGNDLFDFCDVDKFLAGLSGQHLIVEQLAHAVFEHMKQYNPADMTVTVDAESNTHFPVTVVCGL